MSVCYHVMSIISYRIMSHCLLSYHVRHIMSFFINDLMICFSHIYGKTMKSLPTGSRRISTKKKNRSLERMLNGLRGMLS